MKKNKAPSQSFWAKYKKGLLMGFLFGFVMSISITLYYYLTGTLITIGTILLSILVVGIFCAIMGTLIESLIYRLIGILKKK